MFKIRVPVAAGFLLCSALACAQDPLSGEAPAIDKTDTLSVIVATVLALLAIPALALYFGGMVRKKNALSAIVNPFILLAVVSIVWLLGGFTIAYGKSTQGYFGGFEFLWGKGISMVEPYPYSSPPQTVPNGLFMLFQMMFVALAATVICGAVVERVRIGALIFFAILWTLLIYSPIACWVWNPDGWLFKRGILDFAGGSVVHITAAASALSLSNAVGKRVSVTQREPILPHNLTLTLLGAGLLWFSWMGFTAGSAMSAGPIAVTALVNTHLAAATGLLCWLLLDKIKYKKPTALGAASGLVAGLVGITPACGYVSPLASVFVGAAASVLCCLVVGMKKKLGSDDALDVVAIHGLGAAVGLVLTGFLASESLNYSVRDALSAAHDGNGLILNQILTVLAVAAFAFIGTSILFRAVEIFIPLRVRSDEEQAGLDISTHGEAAYNLYDAGYTR